MKVDLVRIEGLSINEQFYGMDCSSVILTPNEVNAITKIVRAAKQVNEHWYEMGSDGDTPVFQYDLYKALSKIEFGGE